MEQKPLIILQAERAQKLALIKKYKSMNDNGPQYKALEQELIQIDLDISLIKEQEQKQKTEQKQEQKAEKEEQKEEETALYKFTEFQKALKLYKQTNMCFHRSAQPTYFYKETYQDYDIKTGAPLSPVTDLITLPHSTLSANYKELESKLALNYFTSMVFGESITVRNPDTNEDEVHQFTPRVYSKLGNTRHQPDPKIYNMIDLSCVMKPTDKNNKCPDIIHQLLLSITGNTESVQEDGSIKLSKPENYEWYCKWLYGVLVADIGNNMLSMPVHFGTGKVGRNAMYDKIIPRALGDSLVFTGLWSNMEGNFDGFKIGKVFVFLDEIPPRDDWNKLKNLTGGLKTLIKKKYGPEFVVENTISMAIGTNHMVYPLPLEDGKQMTRVSPIKAVPESLFAENVYRYFEKQQPGLLVALLEEQGVDTSLIKNDPYELGDKFLRTNEDMWCSKEIVQEFLNFLHYKFSSNKYVLSPLRGQDWDEIIGSKPNPINEVQRYISVVKPDVVTIDELFEIYKVIIGSNTKYAKDPRNFGAEIYPLLKSIGYERKQLCRVVVELSSAQIIKNKQQNQSNTVQKQTTVFHIPTANPNKHIQSVDQYIAEELLGTNTNKILKY